MSLLQTLPAHFSTLQSSILKNKRTLTLLAIPAVPLTFLAICLSTWRVDVGSQVRLRGIVHLFNLLSSNKGNTDPAVELEKKKLFTLFESVVDAERLAFNDDFRTDESKRELFKIQLEGIFGEGNLFSPLGQVLVRKDVEKTLKRRLLFAETCIKSLPYGHPSTLAALKRVSSKLIIIAGLPRTGSTMLHRLLSEDLSTRTPLWWEQMHDVEPLPTQPADLVCDCRAEKVVKDLAGIKIISPNALSEFDRFHKIGAFEVEECAPFIRRYFNDMDSPYLSPKSLELREDWSMNKDVDRSFIIKHLVYWLANETTAFPKDEGKDSDYSWILKAPIFTTFLPEMYEAFPDAAYVFTSRDPVNVIPSTCGLVEVAASIKANWGKGGTTLFHHIGGYVFGRMEFLARKQDEFIRSAEKGDKLLKVINLPYKATIKSPMASVEKIYELAGRKVSEETRRRMEAHLKENTQGKHGKANYSLEKFGLTEGRLLDSFGQYKKDYC